MAYLVSGEKSKQVASYIGEEVPVDCYQYLEFDTKQDRRIVYSMTPMSEHRKFVHTFGKRRDLKVAADSGRATLDKRVNHVMDGFLAEECGVARSGVMQDPKFEERLDMALARIQELESALPARRGAIVGSEHQGKDPVSRDEYENLRERNKELLRQMNEEQNKASQTIAELNPFKLLILTIFIGTKRKNWKPYWV